MPQGNMKPTLRRTEDVARETCSGLFLQARDALRTGTPQGWATAAQKFDEAADACRIAEAELLRRQAEAVKPTAPVVCPVVIRIIPGDLALLLEDHFSCQRGGLR